MMDPRAIADIFAPFGPVRLKRMFSGHGVFVDELCIALELSGEIFLKADGETDASFAAAGSRPFSYQRAGKITQAQSWTRGPAGLRRQAASRCANGRPSASQTSLRASTKTAISSGVWKGPGVTRSRSLPRATVG